MAKRWPVLCGVLLVAAPGAFVWLAPSKPDPNRVQHLEDGSLFCLSRISFNNTNVFTHGYWLERNLGDVIPSKGTKLGRIHLQRRTFESFPDEDPRGLVVEFKRLTTNAPGQQPLALRPPRAVRCLIIGDDGSEYPAESHGPKRIRSTGDPEAHVDELYPILSRDFFKSTWPKHREGEFEYFIATSFPRASAWLTFRLESCDSLSAPNLHWEPLAQFRIENPARSQALPWQPTPLPATNEIDGLCFVLNDITVYPQRSARAEETDRAVTISLQVQSNGVVQPEWRVISARVEDALGNARDRAHTFYARGGRLTQFDDRLLLDPRQPWKLEAHLVRDPALSRTYHVEFIVQPTLTNRMPPGTGRP
jgi:hypothetical protein